MFGRVAGDWSREPELVIPLFDVSVALSGLTEEAA